MVELTGEVTPIGVTLPLPTLAAGGLVTCLGATAGWLGGLVAGVAASVAVLGYLAGAAVIARYWRSTQLGAANTVTLARVVGTSWVAAFVVEAALTGGIDVRARLVMIALGMFCLVLDGVDGRVARSRGEASAFGARFDMETDGALLVCLSLAVALLDVAGWWVLAICGMRYVYVVASRLVPALRVPLYPSYARKVVAVIQGVALLTALALDLVLPGLAPTLVLLAGLATLCWSFGRDIRWQLRSSAARVG